MKSSELRAAIVEELALSWLQVPGHAFVSWQFADVHGLNALELNRALMDLREAGWILLNQWEGTVLPGGVVLTAQGQVAWIHDRAESRLPGVRAQQRLVFQFLQRHQPVSAGTLETRLGLPGWRVHQLVLIMRSLGSVQAAVDDRGQFTEIQVLRPV